MINYFSYPNQQAIALKKASDKINQSLKLANTKRKQVLFMISGGSSLALLSNIDTENLNKQITICPLDERYSLNPKENNMAQIAKTNFYKAANQKGCNFIDTGIKNSETQNQLATRFNQELNLWISLNPKGLIIATIGIGPDGHICGIMPFLENPEKFLEMFDNKDNSSFVIGYDAKEKNPYPKRVTTTMNFVRKINIAIVYVVGENKLKALSALKKQKGELFVSPCRILREIKGDVFVFTDINN